MLRQIDTGLWVDEVDFKLIGINFGNRMTCIKLNDGRWCLHSPNKFKAETYEQLSAMGVIHFLVAPSLMHNLFIMDWKNQQSSTQVLAPSSAKKLSADQSLDQLSSKELNNLFNKEITCVPIQGMPVLQEYAFIHHASRSLILTDLVFNFSSEVKGWAKLFLKLYGAYNKFGPTLTIRMLIKDKPAFKQSLEQILEHDFDRVIMSHGAIIETNGKHRLQQAFKKYL
ncbi:MAG: hypothetical protein OEZ58_17930 [Gammaproteobacteria bacterium]|nr:hypothetical protein [Gammaproteobacteria bacterium]MDH5730871.1 hypothetical protein [Gammaproteobacteria bacterium]